MRSVSVLICTLNRARSLQVTLESLAYLAYPNFEVVVVAGPCTDDTADVLEPYQGRIKILHIGEANVSAARNIGLAASAGDIVAMIDDDAVPDGLWLDDLVGIFDDEDVGVTGGLVYDDTGYELQARFATGDRWGDVEVETGERRLEALQHPDSWQQAFPVGVNFVLRRDAIIAAGGFDEAFTYYLEETEACLRLKDRGYLFRPQTNGFVVHKFLPSQIRGANRVAIDRYQLLASRLYFAFRHGLPRSNHMKLWFSYAEFVRRQRADLVANAEAGRIPPEAVARFDSDLDRAYDTVMTLLSEPPLVRDPAWFASRALPFMAYPTRPAPARRYRIGLVATADTPATRRYAGELADAGHLVHLLTTSTDRPVAIDFEAGCWVHRLPAGADIFVRELDRVHQVAPIDAVQICDPSEEGTDVGGHRRLPTGHLSVEESVRLLGAAAAAPVS